MEPDISILRKTGHFYLAKNRTFLLCVDTRWMGLKCKTGTLKPDGSNGARFGKRPLQCSQGGLQGKSKPAPLNPKGAAPDRRWSA
jgi:hypothetical protein